MNYISSDDTNALYLAAQRDSPSVFLKLLQMSKPKLKTEIINRVTSNPMFPTILMLICNNKNQEWNKAFDLIAPKLNAKHVND